MKSMTNSQECPPPDAQNTLPGLASVLKLAGALCLDHRCSGGHAKAVNPDRPTSCCICEYPTPPLKEEGEKGCAGRPPATHELMPARGWVA
jgi:hypothetical protein